MMEHYKDPDPDEERVTVEVSAPLRDRATERGNLDARGIDSPGFVAIHFTHPNGEEGIMLVYRGPARLIAESFGVDEYADGPIVYVFKHKADNGYNFIEYEPTGDSVAITMTAEMHENAVAYIERWV